MQNRRQIKEEIDVVLTFYMISQAYEQISIMRMQRIRDSVLKTRNFLNKLLEVFVSVRRSYHSRLEERLKKKQNKGDISFLEKNGKNVSVLITTNTRMNGEIIRKVVNEYVEDIKQNDDDLVIVGKTGRQYFEQARTGRKYDFFEFNENDINVPALRELILALLPYKDVVVYFGQFETLLTQEPVKKKLMGDISDMGGEEQSDPYIFEPSPEKILQFYETQIFSSLVKQTINEAELARYASRIRAMEDAMQNIEKIEKGLKMQELRLKKLVNNKKQLEIMSRMSMLN